MSKTKLACNHKIEIRNDVHFIVMMEGEYSIQYITSKNDDPCYSLTSTNKNKTCDYVHLISYTKRELSELLETIFVHAEIPLHKIDLLMEQFREKKTNKIKFYMNTKRKELEIRK